MIPEQGPQTVFFEGKEVDEWGTEEIGGEETEQEVIIINHPHQSSLKIIPISSIINHQSIINVRHN